MTQRPPSGSSPVGGSSGSSSRGRQHFWEGENPTEPLSLVSSLRRTPYRNPQQMAAPERDEEARASLDLAVRVGELLLRCGAGTRDVEASVVAVAAAAGLEHLEVDLTSQSLLVQGVAPGGTPITALRVVRSFSRDFARLVAVHQFVEALVSGEVDRDEAAARLREIQRRRRSWPRWSLSLGYGVIAGSVAALLGAGLAAIGFSMLSSIAVDQLGRFLTGRDVPGFYVSAAGGAVATALAWGALMLGQQGAFPMSTSDFAYVVAAGIVVLLPGRAMTSAVEDAITGYPVTGAGRLFGVALTGAGIIVGVAAGLSLTLHLGQAFDIGLASPTSLKFSDVGAARTVRVAAVAIGAAAAAVTMRTRGRLILPTAALGAVGILVSDLIQDLLGLGSITSLAVSCTLMGFLGRLLALRMGAPALVLVVPAIFPLLPGLQIFRGMYELVSGSVLGHAAAPSGAGVTTLLGASATALAIATGIVLGDVLSSPFDRRVVRRGDTRRR